MAARLDACGQRQPVVPGAGEDEPQVGTLAADAAKASKSRAWFLCGQVFAG